MKYIIITEELITPKGQKCKGDKYKSYKVGGFYAFISF